jgi:lipopolysaccharide/colanic/teichoic acid biosynthesis glycosyltransferase
MIDVMVVASTAVITAPLIILIALFVSLDGHSPFYSQRRLGMGGRSFTLWKLRSMVPDADVRLREHLSADPAARAEWDRTQKLMDDPRITRIGRFIRKCSIDELPQLWNVLRGDMSLVGPRPMMPEQASLYPGISYFALRPGITGTWQVSARNASSFAERARFDSDYYRSVSFGTDLGILLATVQVVVRGTGC